MPRPAWKGRLSFGLVSMAVNLYGAVGDHDIAFRQIDRKSRTRVRYRKVAEGTGEEVPLDQIVKGYELEPGRYVIVEPDELAAIAPSQSGSIAIADFVDLAEIDPVYFASSYYVAPDKGAEEPYRLLRDAMAATGRAAIGEFVMHTRQYLAAVRADGDVLILTTLHFADEIREASEVLPTSPPADPFTGRELDLATNLIEQMTVPWEPERYHDTYRVQVEELINAKAEGSDVVPAPTGTTAPVLDLMEALRRSVERDGSASDDAATSDDGATLEELRSRARRLQIRGRSRMNRAELLEAIGQADRSAAAS